MTERIHNKILDSKRLSHMGILIIQKKKYIKIQSFEFTSCPAVSKTKSKIIIKTNLLKLLLLIPDKTSLRMRQESK